MKINYSFSSAMSDAFASVGIMTYKVMRSVAEASEAALEANGTGDGKAAYKAATKTKPEQLSVGASIKARLLFDTSQMNRLAVWLHAADTDASKLEKKYPALLIDRTQLLEHAKHIIAWRSEEDIAAFEKASKLAEAPADNKTTDEVVSESVPA